MFLRVNVWAAVVSVLTVALSAAVLPEYESDAVSERQEGLDQLAWSLCELMPDLPGCQALNDTLSFEGEGPDDVKEKQHGILPSQVISYLTSLHHHNKELVVKDAQCTFQLASLDQEKSRLTEQITELQRSLPHRRVPRATQAMLISPGEESTEGVTTLLHPSPEQPHLYAQILRPVDCSDYLMMGYTTSGVYNIYPFSCRCSKPVEVWCDMESEGGGWTVFLARNNQSHRENFNRSWNDYREGFGNASGEYWLGNEVLYLMTNTRFYNLRMDFRLITGEFKWGEWYKFKVNKESSRYQLEVPSYNSRSTIEHCFSLSNGRYFSTYDYDNDGSSDKNCAQENKGGWWYNNCGNLDPTIPFTPIGQLNTTCNHKNYNKKVPLLGPWLQIKMRPTICSDSVKAIYFNGYNCQSHND